MMNCLKKFFSRFANSAESSKQEDLLSPLIPDDILSRFIFFSDHFNLQTGKAKYAAFLPTRKGETNISTYRTSNLSESEIWDLELKYVSAGRKDGKRAKARGDITFKVVTETKLEAVALNKPHPRHYDIFGFAAEKGKAKLAAMKLAEHSSVHVRSD